MPPASAPAPAVSSDESAAATCATCDTVLHGPYCHACGEKQLHRHDYRFAHFLEHAVDAVTHFDLRVLRDLGAQLRRPGWLAAEWLRGRRVRHAPPAQLFLVTNLIFYLLAAASHFSPFETKLRYQLAVGTYGAWARRLVVEHLTRTGADQAVFAARFDEAAHIYSKSLVFLFVPLLAVPLWLLFWRQRRYFVEWLALNLYLFGGLLLLYAAVALLVLAGQQVPAAARVIEQDSVMTPIMFGLTTLYNGLYFGRAFPEQRAGWRWVKALGYTAAFVVGLLFVYRPLLFVVCYWAAR